RQLALAGGAKLVVKLARLLEGAMQLVARGIGQTLRRARPAEQIVRRLRLLQCPVDPTRQRNGQCRRRAVNLRAKQCLAKKRGRLRSAAEMPAGQRLRRRGNTGLSFALMPIVNRLESSVEFIGDVPRQTAGSGQFIDPRLGIKVY